MVKRVIFGDIVHQHVRELDLNKREFSCSACWRS
jgi:hypothetical protein